MLQSSTGAGAGSSSATTTTTSSSSSTTTSASSSTPAVPTKAARTWLHSSPWMLDLQNSASHLFGKVVRMCVVGHRVSADEQAHLKWLSSPLFSQGFESGYVALASRKMCSFS